MKNLLLLLVLTVCLFSCQDDSEKIIGTWNIESNECFPSAESVIVFTESHVDGLSLHGDVEYLIEDGSLYLSHEGNGFSRFATIEKVSKKELELSKSDYTTSFNGSCSVFYTR